jgi:membrane protease YdiL (CAAX protease family)
LTSAVEELIYRGFIFFFFMSLFPSLALWWIACISIFIEACRYAPRWVAMKYVATSGLVFTLGYLFFDSVIPAMLLHIAYDLRTLLVPFHLARKSNVDASNVA